MTFTQQTFLGASIRSFSASVGWGNQSSTLEVGLVEDPVNGDSINAPEVGHPVYFNYQGWKFGGLLQSIIKQSGQEGNSVYQVQVQDPRELLAGVQLILDGYNGSTYGIPNIYNIYGWVESTYGFGASRVNETGMPWMTVRDGFRVLQATQPILFRGERFYFAPFVDEILLPQYYRVGGDNISVLDFVEDICGALAYDYFIDMEYKNGANWIMLHTISRNAQLRDDAINTFISNTTGAVSKEQGYELRNETTSKFVVGGRVCDLYFQPQQYTSNDSRNIMYDDTIMPYWGYDCYDRLIIMNNDGTFRLDGRAIAKETANEWLTNYPTDIWEMRAALEGQDAWEAYIWSKALDVDSIHYGKAQLLGVSEGFSSKLTEYIDGAVRDGAEATKKIRTISSFRTDKAAIEHGWTKATTQTTFVDRIYNWINIYASEYYGKKFMVRVPFLLTKLVPETNTIMFSLEPIEAAYATEDLVVRAVYDGWMPANVEKFRSDDDRIKGYVRFAAEKKITNPLDDNTSYTTQYSTNKLSQDDYILDQYPNTRDGFLRENLFVRCEIDPRPVFLDRETLYSPRMVITLPGIVTDEGGPLGSNSLLTIKINQKLLNAAWNQADIDKFINSLLAVYGAELLWFDVSSAATMPDLAVLPLQSNILQYGPWFSAECAGKVEYENDDTLVPWNYGGYDLMNLVGRSKVQAAQAAQLTSERGTIEFPGVPAVQLGDALLDSGPAVTDVSTSVSSAGVTTTYRMSTWTYQYGRIGKYNMERTLRIQKLAQEQRKAFRQLFKQSPPRIQDYYRNTAAVEWARRNGIKSSVNLLAGDVLKSGTGENLRVVTNVAAIAGYRLLSQTNPEQYPTQAGMSLDGIFVPYTTNPSTTYTSYMPHFETPAATAKVPTVDDLNPFQADGVALAFPESQFLPDNLGTEASDTPYTGHVKGIGLKAPIVVGGWGYDIDDKPVPAQGTGFLPNYKSRADMWKVGPLDIRWDDDRKVWTVPPPSSTPSLPPEDDPNAPWLAFLGTVYSSIAPRAYGYARRYSQDWVVSPNTDLDRIFNPHQIELPTGLRVKYHRYKNWTGFIAEPYQFVECSGTEEGGNEPY